MHNNHLRVTFQTACFQENPTERFGAGYPWVISSLVQGRACAGESCMKDVIDAGIKCMDSEGQEKSAKQFHGESSGIEYNFDAENTYARTGGFVYGLGGTPTEAAQVSQIIR